MSREQIPINPENIRWARERAGFTHEDSAKHFKKIAEWEAGDSAPTYPQIEQLAEKFKIPVAVFFFPEPPKLPPISETFRTLPDTEFAQIPRKVRQLLRKAKALQLNLDELCQGKNPADRLITNDLGFSIHDKLPEMAASVREYIGISIDDQISWQSADDALKNWRDALYAVGIFVFKDAFRETGYSGFCLYDPVFPVIYVNNSTAKTRQIFTLFHELAHLLFQTSGIDTADDSYIDHLKGDSQAIEIMCNQFAAEFLVPDIVFNDALKGNDASEHTAETLANRFHVSREFVFRKFLDRNLIDEAAYTEAAERWAGQRGNGAPGGNPYWTRIAYLGRDYIRLALTQYHQNRIDQQQLAQYLGTKEKNVGTLEEYYARGEA